MCGELSGGIRPERPERGQLNASNAIDEILILRLARFGVFSRVLMESGQEVADLALGNENSCSLNERLVFSWTRPLHTSKFNTSMFVLKRLQLEIHAGGCLKLNVDAGSRRNDCGSLPPIANLLNGSLKGFRKPLRVFNPVRRAFKRLRPSRPTRGEAFRLRRMATMICRRLREPPSNETVLCVCGATLLQRMNNSVVATCVRGPRWRS